MMHAMNVTTATDRNPLVPGMFTVPHSTSVPSTMLNSSQSSATTPTSFGSFDTTTPASSVVLDRLMTTTNWDAGAVKENGDAPESSKMGGDALVVQDFQ